MGQADIDILVLVHEFDGRRLCDLAATSVEQSDSLEFRMFQRRADLLNSIFANSGTRRCVALIWVSDPTAAHPDPRGLRLIETIRRSSLLHNFCRPVAIAQRSDDSLIEHARRSGAFGFVDTSCISGPDGRLAEFLKKVASHVPRKFDHGSGVFVTLAGGTPVSDQRLEEFGDVFRELFAFESGPHDYLIIHSWANEVPEKTVVDTIGSDSVSGWSASAISRRIEKLREAAPVLYRDSSGNLAKVRLANALLARVRQEATDAIDIRLLPDVDRCIELMGDDDLMRAAFVDDDARLALASVANRRIVDSSRRGGRPSASERAARLDYELTAAFANSFSTRFASERTFRATFARALFAIADTQIDMRITAPSLSAMGPN